MMKQIIVAGFFAAILGLAAVNLFARAPEATLNSLSGKLDQVMKTQGDIIRKLDELKTEVNIVKIRATRG